MKYNDNGTAKDIVIKAGDTLPVGTIVEYDGDTIPSGWEEVEDIRDDYSTEEQIVGKWINGKPIYRRTVYTTIKKDYVEGSMFFSFITVKNLEELIDAKGKLNTSSANYSKFLPNRSVDFSYNTNVNGDQKVYLEYTDINLVGLAATVTLEYTKSTDTAIASEEI